MSNPVGPSCIVSPRSIWRIRKLCFPARLRLRWIGNGSEKGGTRKGGIATARGVGIPDIVDLPYADKKGMFSSEPDYHNSNNDNAT